MRSRLILAVGAMLFAAPVLAAPPTPHLLIQAKPIDEWLADAKALVKAVIPPDARDAPDPEKMVDEMLAGFLGKDWRTGVDTTKPVGGYAVFKAELIESILVKMVPVKDEKAFVAALGNLGDVKALGDGTHTLQTMAIPIQMKFRFAHGYAYVWPETATVGADDLLKPADVFAAEPGSALTVRLKIDALPAELKKVATDALGQAGPAGDELVMKMLKFYTDSIKSVVTDGREIVVGLDFDRKAGRLAATLEATAAPGSPLAKTFKDAKPSTSRFPALAAGAAGYFGQHYSMPNLSEMIFSTQGDRAAEGLQKDLAELGITVDKEKAAEIFKLITTAADIGVTDTGIAVYVKDGKASAVYGVRIKDGAKLEQALTDLVKGADASLKDRVKINAGKIGSANVHRIAVGKDFPEPARKAFGTDELTVVIAADAVLVAIGPEAEARIKAALESQPQPAAMVAVEGSLAQLMPLVEAVAKDPKDRELFKTIREFLGKDVDRVRLVQLTRTPGETMKYRLELDVVMFAKLVFGVGRRADSGAIPPPPIKP